MKLRKLLIILVALVLIFSIGLILINQTHPIILKWLIGSARIIGKPINATVYTNDHINRDIKVYHVGKYWNGDKADYYILYCPNAGGYSMLKYFCLDKQESFAGRPVSTNIENYDHFAGYLFQSDVGALFTPFQDDMKGFGFDPHLTFTTHQIKLNIPPAGELKCDSIRVEL